MTDTFDLARTFLHLGDGGAAEPIEITPAFWSGASAQDHARVLGAVDFRSARDLHSTMQEMHPEVDEVLLVVSGAIDVLVDRGDGEHTIALSSGQVAIVPRGVWHRLVMRKPGRLVFVNNRKSIQSRPLRSERGGC
jgi:mannose-6-phosphate isomerase-like protein (cupin superfamily)